MKIQLYLVLLTIGLISSQPIHKRATKNADSDDEARGILDGLGGSSTPVPSGGGLAGMGQAIGNSSPMLVIGTFQAIVMKYDPAIAAGLPGMPSLPVG